MLRCRVIGACALGVLALAPAPAQACPAAGPTEALAWRAEVARPVPVYTTLPGRERRSAGTVRPRAAAWLMVTRVAEDARGRCWVRVRLPWRPSSASGWVSGARVRLEPTPWRITVSRAKRSLRLLQDGRVVMKSRVVIGAPATPTPRGRFAVLWVQPWSARAFLGSWVFGLTAHSRVLDTFNGGDGRVAIHGRGGASLRDPLGSARSHGCVRVPNAVADRIVRRVGADELLGVPVEIS